MKYFLHKHWILTSIGILFFAAVWIWLSAVPSDATTGGNIPAPMVGFQAPDIELDTLTGETIVLSDLRGKAVLVNFWASWCPPCRSEMPAIQRIYEEYGPDEFVILAVNSAHQDRLSDVDSFVAENGLTFPILLDTTGLVTERYQVRSLPTSFFVDQDGMIREIVIGGPMAEALLRTRAEDLLLEGR